MAEEIDKQQDDLREAAAPYGREELAPADAYDPVIEAYKKDVDRTLLRENLKLTVDQRLQKLEDFAVFINEVKLAGRKSRERKTSTNDHALSQDPPATR